MDVGTRELKQHLSQYLDRVERGETIRVTNRGVPKALITPVNPIGQLEIGIAEGWIRPASTTGLAPALRALIRASVRDVLAEDRAEDRAEDLM